MILRLSRRRIILTVRVGISRAPRTRYEPIIGPVVEQALASRTSLTGVVAEAEA
jgi:hypothetical protein